MSIILDALKKAQNAKNEQNDGSEEEVSGNASGVFLPSEAPVISNVDNAKRTKIIVLALIAIAGLGIILFNSLGSNLLSSPKEAVKPLPKMKTSAVKVAESKTEKLEDKSVKEDKNSEEVNSLKKEASDYFIDRKYDKATYVYKQLVNLAPTDPEIYNNYGLSLKKLGKPTESKQAYNTALALKPDYPEALNNLAVIEISERKFGKAKLRLQQAIDARPDYLDPYLHMAICLEKSGDMITAKQFYQEFLDRSEGKIGRKIRLQIETRLARLNEEL